jgi:hypothetical protein
MTIVGSLVIAIALVALIIVAVLAQFTDACNGKMSRLLLIWLLLVLGDLLKNASCFVGRLMCLGLREEDVFALLLCRGKLHCLTEVATVKIADELYWTPHELMHLHEGGLLGSAKPEDQMVANIGEPCNCLKEIPDAFVKVHCCTVYVSGALLGNNACPFS